MSGSVLECHRYYDGLCNGGPCETCKYDAVNEHHDMKITIAAQRLVIVELLALVLMVIILS